MLGTLDFTGPEHQALLNFSKTTVLVNVLFVWLFFFFWSQNKLSFDFALEILAFASC